MYIQRTEYTLLYIILWRVWLTGSAGASVSGCAEFFFLGGIDVEDDENNTDHKCNNTEEN